MSIGSDSSATEMTPLHHDIYPYVTRDFPIVSNDCEDYYNDIRLAKIADPCLIHKYARHGDLKSIKEAVENLPKREKLQYISGMDSSQLTPLHYACRYNNKRIVEYLLDNMVDANARDSEGLTPLHYAARYSFDNLKNTKNASNNGDPSIVVQLISKGARKDARDRYQLTPLHYAAMKDNYKAVQDILSYGHSSKTIKNQKVLIEARDENGMTPLLRSASHGSDRILEYLLSYANADLFAVDRQQNTALHLACQRGHFMVVEKILKALVKLRREEQVEARNSSEDRALHLAVDANCTSIVEALIRFRCDVSASRAFGNTALHSAASKGYRSIVEILHHAKADILAINNIWDTPLHNAARYNQYEVVKYICQLKAGEIVSNTADSEDEKIDDNASENTYEKFPDNIVQTEVIEALNVNHETPFLVAVSDGRLETVKVLCEAGANILVKDNDDRNCILLAAQFNCLQTLKYLLERLEENKDLRAKLINCPNKFHETALHIASINGYQEICETLHEAGALLNARDDNQETPLHFAAKGGKTNIVKKLLEWDPKLLVDTNETSNTALHLAAAQAAVAVRKLKVDYKIRLDDHQKDGRTLWLKKCEVMKADISKVLKTEQL